MMVFQCFSWDFLLGIYDEKYVPFFGLIMFRLNDWKWLMDGQGYCW
jgi:hypothetical protein